MNARITKEETKTAEKPISEEEQIQTIMDRQSALKGEPPPLEEAIYSSEFTDMVTMKPSMCSRSG
jgi:hypothetical protein